MRFFARAFIPALVTLGVHAVILGVLLIGWEASPPPKRIVPPNYVKAELVQLKDKSKKKASAKKKPKKIDLTAKRKEQERLKREAEKKRKAQQAKKKKAEAEKKRKAAEKKKREEEKRKKAEAEARELEQRLQQEFEQALAEEEGMLLEEEYATEAQSFAARIRQRVENNWARPPSARTGMRCVLEIQLVPTGRIVSVNVKEGSGNSAFDRSAIQAVKKVEAFPEIKEMKPEVFERYYRKFNFLFDPQDLRL